MSHTNHASNTMGFFEKRRQEEEARLDALPVGPYSLLKLSTRTYAIIRTDSQSIHDGYKTLNFHFVNEYGFSSEVPCKGSFMKVREVMNELNRKSLGV